VSACAVSENEDVARSGYCPYCAQTVERLTIEHPIPQRIGGTVEIQACERCNREAARSVDNPAMAWPDVEVLRGLYDVRSPKHPRRKPQVQIPGTLAGTATALYRPGKDIEVEQVQPTEPVYNDDGTFTFTLPIKNADVHAAKLKQRIEQEHPGRTVTLQLGPEQQARTPFEHKWGITPWVWPTFFAKIAVAVLHETMPLEWRDSDPYLRLLWLFRQGRQDPDLLMPGAELAVFPTGLQEGDFNYEHLTPWEHLLVVFPLDGGVRIDMTLFGELHLRMCVATDLQPVRGASAWLMDARALTNRVGPMNLIVGSLALRASEHGSTVRLRLPRPRARLLAVEGQGSIAPA
jgi:hypothetical protein